MRVTSLLRNQIQAYENIIPSYEGSNDKGSHISISVLFTENTQMFGCPSVWGVTGLSVVMGIGL
jgi:hypothetical protein